MVGRPVLVERTQAVDAAAAQVWPVIRGPEAAALRPASFAFDLAATSTSRLRVVLSVPLARPIFVVYEVVEDVACQVLSLTVPGRPADREEAFMLSAVSGSSGSQVSIQVRCGVADANAQAVLADYWKRTLPLWLDGIRDVAEGRAPLPDGRMPAGLQAACTPSSVAARSASASASVLIGASVADVWAAVCSPDSAAILMSSDGPVHAGVIPGTPLRQPGQMQYFITYLHNGEFRNTITMVTEAAAERFALICPVGGPGPEMAYRVEPDRHGTRLELTFRWPAGVPDHRAVARSMADAVRHRVRAFKDLIENPHSPWTRRPPAQ